MTESSATNRIGRRAVLQAAGGAALLATSGTALGAVATQESAPAAEEYGSILDAMAGSGSQSDPYVVTDVTELQAVNGDLAAAYVLGSDVDAAATSEWHDGKGFDPLGSWETSFSGQFDGAAYRITGLTMNRPDADYAGLFRGVTADASVDRLGLVDASITGKRYVGGLVGDNEGTVTRSFTTGEVTAEGPVAAGLVGEHDGTVETSYSTATVAGDRRSVAGLIGTNGGDVSRSFAAGTVDGNGGVVGANAETGTVTDCYWNSDTIEFVGASTPGTGLTEAEMTGEAAGNSMTAFDFQDTWRTVTDPAGFPQLQWVPAAGETPTGGSNGTQGDGGDGDGSPGSSPDDENSPGSGPGFGVAGAVAGVVGMGYGLGRRLQGDDG
jgi:hypothetical protein